MIPELFLISGICFLFFYFDKRPYWRVVRKWAKPFNLKIRYYNRYTDIFECDPDEGVIYISRFNKAIHDRREYIYSIAHEIGHLIGALIDEDYPERQKISERRNKEAIIKDEERAWDLARLLLKDAGIYEYHSFKSLREKCLSTYKAARYEHHEGLTSQLCSRQKSQK